MTTNAEYGEAKTRLVAEKAALQAQLADVNAKCAVRLSSAVFGKVQKERAELVRRLQEKEMELAQCKLNHPPPEYHAPRGVVRELSDIRDRFSEFASDEDYHQAYRLAASHVVRDLNGVLKKLCAPENGTPVIP